MLKRLLVTAMAAMLAAGMGYADQSKVKVTIPVNKTAATSGKQMYASYCAPCHGVDGRGQGPVASALKTPPADLTALSRNNRGKLPDTHIYAVLQNGAEIPSHGSAEMPAWGPILGKMNQSNPQERMLRISNLSRYLETIQAK
ncbi:MAG: c-type cytochrome [Terracidiphilus sp.]|jgi:mono/diheme cytochrome c family protein